MREETDSDRGQGQTTTKVDVRSIPPHERHPRIFGLYDSIEPGETLVLVTDHEPRPLRSQFTAKYEGRFSWEQRELGHAHWEAIIRKLNAASGDLATAISRAPLFASFNEADVAELAHRARVVQLRRGRAVIEQGVVWPYVGIVLSGLVQAVLVTADGREVALFDALPGDAFGTIALADAGASPLRFVARDGTSAILIPIDLIRSRLEINAALSKAVQSHNAQLMRRTFERFAAHVAQPVTARIAEALLAYASPDRGMTPALDPLPRMKQVDLAALAGTSSDMVYRAISELADAGALERDEGRILRLDRNLLLRFAETVKY